MKKPFLALFTVAVLVLAQVPAQATLVPRPPSLGEVARNWSCSYARDLSVPARRREPERLASAAI